MAITSLSLNLGRRLSVVLQAEAAECGLACLAMVAGFHGFETDLNSLRARFAVSIRGVTLTRLMQIASDLRLATRAVRLEPHSLGRLQVPCILHWNLDHFVVLERVEADYICLIDPSVGHRRISIKEVSNQFTGIALEVTPSETFQKGKHTSTLTLSPFFRSVRSLPATLGKLFLLSLGLQSLALLMPFFSQLVIDEVVPGADYDLLSVLMIAFSVILMLNVAMSAMRSFFILTFGSKLQFAWATRLFHHLLRLPLEYFEKRHVADVLSRFRSLGPIQGLATGAIVESFIDGIMAVTTLGVMLFYGTQLTVIPVVALMAYAAVRFGCYGPQRENAQEALILSARENSHFLESLRGALAIKSFAKEQVRESSWQNRAAAAISATYKTSAFTAGQQLANQLLFGLENLVVMWVAARAVMEGGFSIGMLVAFLAYKTQFTARGASLIDKWMEFKLASVHLDRLSDIALAEEENGLRDGPIEIPPINGALSARNVCFRHGPAERYVLWKVNCEIAPGECVAIVGPSGVGKTTFLKILMSLLKPESGEVLVDGIDIHANSTRAYRGQIASVMQEDMLMSGTLSDNIAFFDPRPDRERIEECARAAAIHEDIRKMPMGYFTLVGDMGTSLSGGQKQRVLLARALYSSPRILFLDEATSHLDPATEQKIHKALSEMKITRIVVAHRRETLSIADRVVQLGDPTGLVKNADGNAHAA